LPQFVYFHYWFLEFIGGAHHHKFLTSDKVMGRQNTVSAEAEAHKTQLSEFKVQSEELNQLKKLNEELQAESHPLH
jgi:uncharacterized protein YydD (DUF2326 family)